MLASGSVVAGVGALVVSLLALLFRHPNAPRWAQSEIVALLAGVVVTGIVCFGLASIAYGLNLLVRGAGNPLELLVFAGVVIALAVAWKRLRVRERLKSYDLATAGTNVHVLSEPKLATDEAPPPTTPRPRSPRPLRKAA